MRQLYPDLWQTSPERPLPSFPSTTCNAYLLVREVGNVLFYSALEGHAALVEVMRLCPRATHAPAVSSSVVV